MHGLLVVSPAVEKAGYDYYRLLYKKTAKKIDCQNGRTNY